MSKPAVIQGTYSDLRFVKSRKIAQVVVELPIEEASRFVEMFGTPNPATETWIALARLDTSKVEQFAKHQEKRRFETLKEAMQAGIRCNEPAFWRFLDEHYYQFIPYDTEGNCPSIDNEEIAAATVRKVCDVPSRSNLNLDPRAAAKWQELDARFQLWMREPRHA